MILRFPRSTVALATVAVLGASPVVSAQDDGGVDSGTIEVTSVETVESTEDSGFFFQGGYGFFPERVLSLGGGDARPPVDFTFTLMGSYNDNIYSTPNDRHGSFVTEATIGTNVLLSGSRTFLSLSAAAGAEYYWDKHNEPWSPVFRLSLAYAYKITPRLELTARISSGYYSQPDLSQPNAPARANAGDYFRLDSLFDLSYRWSERFATTTSFGVNTQLYRESISQDSNYVSLLAGQVFRFIHSPRLSSVLDLRYSRSMYDDDLRNSHSEFALAGVDFRFTSRLSGSVRGGAEFRQFDQPGAKDAVSPYGEASLGYRYGRGSLVQWTTRFGFEDGYVVSQKNQTFRTGLQVTQVITPRINARIGGSYSHQRLQGIAEESYSATQQLLTGNVGFDFVVNRNINVFANYQISAVINDDSAYDYHTNIVSLGATYRF